MRGVPTEVNRIRRRVFAEVAKAALYSGNIESDLERIPYLITPAERPRYRESIYRERAIAAERVRLALGMSLNPQDRPAHITNGFAQSNISDAYYEPPLMQVIPSACDKCEENKFTVNDKCRKCVARYCVANCPTGAVSVREDGYAAIDESKCIHCGKCKQSCPYDAITHTVRPCARACGVNAIRSDALGRAEIDPERCVGCGQCMVACPFGAIADKSQIYQLLRALKQKDKIVAEVAPAVAGQFSASLGQLRAALKAAGFYDMHEVARGADVAAATEARAYAEEVATGKLPYLFTSCCPSWSMLVKSQFPDEAGSVSSALTPMVTTARSLKERNPGARIVFIGPCAAKKLEAMRRSVRSDVDFVITFEELAAIFEAMVIDPAAFEAEPCEEATAAGRGYGMAGGVAAAIEGCVKTYYPGTEVKIDHAEGLFDCKKMLLLAAHGKKNGYLMEGMACIGGCAGGAGVNVPVEKGIGAVKEISENTEKKLPPKSFSDFKVP